MERAAHITETQHPLVWGQGKTHLVQDTRTTLEKGTPITIGMPIEARYDHEMCWVVPILEDGKEERFLPQDSVYPE